MKAINYCDRNVLDILEHEFTASVGQEQQQGAGWHSLKAALVGLQ